MGRGPERRLPIAPKGELDVHTVLRGARAIGAVLGLTALLQGIGLAAGPAADATTVMTATSNVNVRRERVRPRPCSGCCAPVPP